MSDLIDPPDDAPEAEPSDEQKKSAADKIILDEARKRYRMCVEADGDNRIAALADLAFLTGGEAQWDDLAVAARKADGRPIITVNTLPTYLHQVTNDQRMNAPSIKVHPVDDGADIETAKVRQGMIRHIEYDSNADVATDRAVNSAAAVGFGYWRLVTEFETPSSMNQKIMYKSIRNALSVRMDPFSTEPDGSDQQFCFVESMKNRAEFKKQYPNAKASVTTLGEGYDDISGWLSDSSVLECEYYSIEKTECEVVQLSDGTSGFIDEMLPDGDESKLPQGLAVARRRPGQRPKLMWYRITGCDILDREEIKCPWIPVFPVYGDEVDIAGKVVRSGIIRNAKGPAQMYNVMITSATEEVSLRAKAPFIGAEGQFEGYEGDWQQANTRAFPFLEYKPVTIDGNLAPAPQRQPMADVPTGTLAMAMHARDNVKATTGLFDSSLGAKGTATSGIQEREQQQQGDMANFHFADGLLRSLRHCGRCINHMLKYYYDTERTIRILGEDDAADYAVINQPSTEEVEDERGEKVAVETVLNDMSGGDYDITVAAGASFATMRQENAEFFANAMSAAKDPGTAAVITYLAMQNNDAPGAEEATAMLKTLLPPQAAAVLDIKKDKNTQPDIQTPKGPLPVAQVPQVLMQLETELQQCKEALEKSGADKNQAEVLKQQAEKERVALERERAEAETVAEGERIKIEQTNAETARMKAETERAKAQAEADAKEAELLLARAQLQVDARAAEAIAANGDTTAFEAWKATLESNTRIMVAEIAARSAERKAVTAAQQKKPPAGGAEMVRPQA